MKRGGRLRPVSKKRASQEAERRRVCKVVLERDRQCMGQHVFRHRCIGGLVVHEVIPRSLWPGGWLEPDNCIAVCWWLNGWIEDHTAEAVELGLAKPSWGRQP